MPTSYCAGMSEEFVPLESYLLRAHPSAVPQEHVPPQSVLPPADDAGAALAELRRFRAALADAVDAALPRLLEDIALNVIGRELRLEGADIAAVVERAVERHAGELVRVHANQSDLPALAALGVPCVADASLEPGAFRAELRSGTIASSLRGRLEAALSVWR